MTDGTNINFRVKGFRGIGIAVKWVLNPKNGLRGRLTTSSHFNTMRSRSDTVVTSRQLGEKLLDGISSFFGGKKLCVTRNEKKSDKFSLPINFAEVKNRLYSLSEKNYFASQQSRHKFLIVDETSFAAEVIQD